MDTKFLSFFRLTLLAIIFICSSFIQAQDDYQTQMDGIFDIPAYKVTTGVLINRSPNIIEIQDFKMQPDSSNTTAINVINWFELFYRLYSSHLNMSGFSYDMMLAKIPRQKSGRTYPLGLDFLSIRQNSKQSNNKSIMKPILKKCAILLLLVSLSSCELFEDNDKRTYYDVKGVGYAYYKDTKEPAANVQVTVMSSFKSNGWATVQPIKEHFPTDNYGYFSVKFLKRTSRENVIRYGIWPNKDNYWSEGSPNFTAEEVKNVKGVIQVDTLWLNPVWKD